ncbi:MAG: HAMP domain-containing histidine kinase [Dehalococcoidia bacterium]|nr:MAG: HAMP domain-containing histidine kinase [Dehalococcoidia bacterium]
MPEVKSMQGKPKGKREDVAERKRAVEELREHRQHLEELVKERTAELQEEITERKKAQEKLERLYETEKRLREQLEEEMKKRAEFTRALAHELKTPLTPVVMSSQTLVSQLQEGPLLSLEPLMRLAANISRGAANLNSRIDELLDLARGEMGMLKLKTEPVDVLALLREVMDDVSTMASNKGQSVVSRLSHSLPSISADRTRLRQIVLNLLNNAFKFTPHGGRITLRAKEDDGNLTVEVKDTGAGISKEEQERLFEPYHRVEHDRERLSGLGLGLALCKTLVELHGGRIWVKSGVGKGSTFAFSLPLESSAGEQETLTAGEE